MIDLDAIDKDPWPTWPVDKNELRGLVDEIHQLRAALRSIAANACCDSCHEAALVARAALEGEKK